MDSNQFLNDLYVEHKHWIKVVKSFGEYSLAEDIVQEMYLKLAKHENKERFYRNGVVYKGFIWIVLRNMYYDFEKSKHKLQKVDITEAIQLVDESEPNEKTEAQIELENKINKTVDSWHWYDKMLFDLHKNTGMSTRKIQKATGISFKSVWQTLKYCKESLKEEVGEHYQDYINQDYELIK